MSDRELDSLAWVDGDAFAAYAGVAGEIQVEVKKVWRRRTSAGVSCEERA